MHTIKDVVKQLIGKSLDAYNKKYTSPINNRIDTIVAQAGTDNTEIVDARIDSAGVTHTTLNNRIIAETKMNDQHLVSCSGEYITAENTMGGSITNLEVLGNTIQNEEDLADIKSVGELQEDGTYKMSILSCGKNLFNPLNKNIECSIGGSQNKVTYKVEGDKIIIKSNPSVSSDWGWVEFKNIKVTPNKSYTIHPNATVIKGNVCVFVFDSNNTKLFEIPNTSKTFIPTTKHITIRLYVQTTTSYTDAEIHYKPQLEEGTQATPYEPYQENKCDILLPCQLEKVGDVSDRIICKDGVWGVEKNIKTIYTKEFANGIGSYEDKGGTYRWGLNLDTPKTFLLTNFLQTGTLSTESTQTQVMLYNHATHREFRISFKKSDFPNFDIQSNVVDYLSNETRFIKIVQQPTFIPLPRNTQIALNSFFGTTHVYMESGEVEGTIKCKIPKSLGATVQSLNNKTDILSDRIEAIEGLKDSQNMKYETDKGYLVCKETKNGVIDDLKIEGKTLVNLSTLKDKTLLNASNDERRLDFNTSMFKASTDYTLIMNVGNVANATRSLFIQWDFIDDSASKFNTISNVSSLANSTVVFKFRQDILPSKLKRVYLSLHIDDSTSCTCEIKDCIVLEGDHTQNPPSYFEGLMSVGQDVDKIEVLSVNENLVPSDWDYKFQCFGDMKVNQIDTRTFEIVNTNTVDGIVISKNFINKFCYNNKVVFDFYSNQRGVFYVLDYGVSGESYKPVQGAMVIEDGRNVFVVDVSNASGRLAFRFNNNTKNSTMIISDFSIKTSENSNNVNHQSDKKQILFYNENGELEPIQELHEWDSIEKHSDNKLYYHKRSGKVVLNGSEDWITTGSADEDTLLFYMKFNAKPCEIYSARKCISDKINSSDIDLGSKNIEGIYTAHDGNICIRISKSKLSTQDVQGFKQWLQANNVTALYQLAKEEVYEITPLHLDSYANETLILCNSGAISPKMEFSITSHINELVKSQGERINLLEEKVYQYMVTQNRMQLASTYSADSVTFKVDYFSLCGDEENYDEDLYNLILNNILVGKDNYNYDKMFTMILDYASWNQISWEQFDILVGLMDMQHNPPVEEEITEDEPIEETPVE